MKSLESRHAEAPPLKGSGFISPRWLGHLNSLLHRQGGLFKGRQLNHSGESYQRACAQVRDQGQHHAGLQWHFKGRHQRSPSQVLSFSLKRTNKEQYFKAPMSLSVCPKCICLFPRRPGYRCNSCWCRGRQVDLPLISVHKLRTGSGCSQAWEDPYIFRL